MSKRQILMIIGVWVAIFLFLGFPYFWDKVLAVLTGLIILIISYRQAPHKENKSKNNLPYIDHHLEKQKETTTKIDSPVYSYPDNPVEVKKEISDINNPNPPSTQ